MPQMSIRRPFGELDVCDQVAYRHNTKDDNRRLEGNAI
jgi:hypothetical protein